MNRPWIRLYTDVPHNAKVQSLPGDLFKFWVNCLCIAGAEDGRDGILPPVKELAFMLRMKPSKCREALEKLAAAALLRPVLDVPGALQMHDWSDYNPASDFSNERVKRYRDRRKNVTCNVTVTAQKREEENREEKTVRPDSTVVQMLLKPEVDQLAQAKRMDRRTVSKPNSQPTNRKDLDALLTEALACEDKLNCKLLDQEPPDKTALKLAVLAGEHGLTVTDACAKIREARDKARGRPDLKPQGAGWLFGVVRGQAFG